MVSSLVNLQNRNIEAILIDHGNVMSLDSGPGALEIMNFFHINYGENLDKTRVEKSLEEQLPVFQEGHIGELEFWQRFLRDVKVVQPILEVDSDKDISLWNILGETYDNLSQFTKSSVRIVRKLQEDFKVGLISNTIEPLARINQEKRRYSLFGRNVFLSYELRTRKPKIEIFRKSCEIMGCLPEKTILIDDSETNIIGAQEIMIKGIKFNAKQEGYKTLIGKLKEFNIYI